MGIINYIFGTLYEKIIGIRFWGGEVSYTYGFGIGLEKVYPEYSVNNPIESYVTIHIAPINFILTVMMLGIVIYLICLLAEKCKKNSESREIVSNGSEGKEATYIIEKAGLAYSEYDALQNLHHKRYPGGHALTEERFNAIIEWIVMNS